MSGTIRLGVLQTLGPYLLPHLLPDLHRTYPSLKLYVREGMPQALVRGIDDGSLDLLLFPLPLQGGDLTTVSLFRESLWIVSPNTHPLAAKKRVVGADLKGEDILTLEPGYRLHDQVRDLCEEYGAILALDYEGTSLDTLRQMVGMGMGHSFLPALYVRAEALADEQIVARTLQPRGPSRTIGMVWRRRSSRQEEFTALAGLVRDILRRDVPEVTVIV